MKKIYKKSVIKASFIYLLLTTGLWMFILSYSNSHNKLSSEKIASVSITLNESYAEMSLLENRYCLNLSGFVPDSKIYHILYICSSDEVRFLSSLISLFDKF